MRVFVTGASGFIGSALVPELIDAGHHVIGLARSDASAAALSAQGAEVHRGALDDLDALRAGAAKSDAVIHLAFVHDFIDAETFAAAARIDQRAIEVLGAAIEGSGKPLVIASGVVGVAPGRLATERDEPPPSPFPRQAGAQTALSFIARGVRTSIVRLPPTVHGRGDKGLVSRLIRIAREKGVSAHIGDGSNRWPAVHRLDAAHLLRLVLEKAPTGPVHPIADEGVPTRTIAEVIGRHLGLPVVAISPDDAGKHFGWLGAIFGLDVPASSTLTRALLSWQPTRQGLIADLDEGHYFDGTIAYPELRRR